MTQRSTISIVIPTCNRLNTLFPLLDSLAPQKESPLYEVEVIISDDGKRDDTAQIRQLYPWVQYLRGPQRGPSSNRNNGARSATGDLLLFLDDDCIASPTLLSSYVREWNENPDVSVFEGRITAIGTRTSHAEECPVNETGGYLWSCNLAILRTTFMSLGGFEERFRFPAMEDVDFRERLMERNTRIKFVPEAQVFHAWEIRMGWKRIRHYLFSNMFFAQLHPVKGRQKPSYFIKVRVKEILYNGILSWNVYRFRGVSQLLLGIANDWRLALFGQFPALGRWYIARAKPCCAGCEAMLTTLRQAPIPVIAEVRR